MKRVEHGNIYKTKAVTAVVRPDRKVNSIPSLRKDRMICAFLNHRLPFTRSALCLPFDKEFQPAKQKLGLRTM
jgi:hypothetical protein